MSTWHSVRRCGLVGVFWQIWVKSLALHCVLSSVVFHMLAAASTAVLLKARWHQAMAVITRKREWIRAWRKKGNRDGSEGRRKSSWDFMTHCWGSFGQEPDGCDNISVRKTAVCEQSSWSWYMYAVYKY